MATPIPSPTMDDAILYNCVPSRSWDRIRLLLKKASHAQIFFVRPDTGSSILQALCEHDAPVDVVKMLLSKGVDVNAKEFQGCTALMIALKRNSSVDLVRTLLAAGADVHGRTYRQLLTPLLTSVFANGKPAIVQLLLKHGANPNEMESMGYSVLHIAAQHASPEVVELLLQHGGNPNNLNYEGCTPLHVAAFHGASARTVILLCEYGADVSARAPDGSTAWSDVVDIGHEHLIPILRNPPKPVKALQFRQFLLTDGTPVLSKCGYCEKPAGQGKKLGVCKACKQVAYCDMKCATAAWPTHKSNCGKPMITSSSTTE